LFESQIGYKTISMESQVLFPIILNEKKPSFFIYNGRESEGQ